MQLDWDVFWDALPHVRFDAEALKLFDGADHQSRSQLPFISSVVASELVELRLFCGNQQLEHEAAPLRSREIIGKLAQPPRLALVHDSVALGIVTHEDLAEGWTDAFDMLGKILAIFEIELMLPAFLGRAGGDDALGCRIAKQGRAELLVH
jgi:hypothetical protein